MSEEHACAGQEHPTQDLVLVTARDPPTDLLGPRHGSVCGLRLACTGGSLQASFPWSLGPGALLSLCCLDWLGHSLQRVRGSVSKCDCFQDIVPIDMVLTCWAGHGGFPLGNKLHGVPVLTDSLCPFPARPA